MKYKKNYAYQEELVEAIRNSLGGDEKEDFEEIFIQLNKYKEGFDILMEYWDSIYEDEQPKVDKRLKRLGL